MNEEAGFHHKINQEPFEPIHHLAYADWLEDNNRSDEAEMRRAYGHWLSDGQTEGGWGTPETLEPWRPVHQQLYRMFDQATRNLNKQQGQQRLQRRAKALRFARH